MSRESEDLITNETAYINRFIDTLKRASGLPFQKNVLDMSRSCIDKAVQIIKAASFDFTGLLLVVNNLKATV